MQTAASARFAFSALNCECVTFNHLKFMKQEIICSYMTLEAPVLGSIARSRCVRLVKTCARLAPSDSTSESWKAHIEMDSSGLPHGAWSSLTQDVWEGVATLMVVRCGKGEKSKGRVQSASNRSSNSVIPLCQRQKVERASPQERSVVNLRRSGAHEGGRVDISWARRVE